LMFTASRERQKWNRHDTKAPTRIDAIRATFYDAVLWLD